MEMIEIIPFFCKCRVSEHSLFVFIADLLELFINKSNFIFADLHWLTLVMENGVRFTDFAFTGVISRLPLRKFEIRDYSEIRNTRESTVWHYAEYCFLLVPFV